MSDEKFWQETVEAARARGGSTIAPNGLPIICVRHDGMMLEHEHADHSDYKFPVEATYVGKLPPDCDPFDFETEQHALIYTDGHIALTMYECCYALWTVSDGLLTGGSIWERKKWRLTEASLERIRAQRDAK